MITANPDFKEYTLGPNEDFMLLGCDGVWEKMNN